MRARLLVSAVLTTLAAVVVLGVPLAVVGRSLIRNDAANRLERDADEIAAAVEDQIEAGRPLTAGGIRNVVPGDLRVQVRSAGGQIVTTGDHVAGPILSARSHTAEGTIVFVHASADPVNRRVLLLWSLIGGLGAAGVLIGAGLAILQAQRLAAPMTALAKTSERLGAGDFSARAQKYGIPEVDAAAEALDSSARQIAELVAAERRFTSSVSHQLKTPLTAMRIRLEEAVAATSEEDASREVAAAIEQIDRVTATIDDLLALTRRDRRRERVSLDLAALVRAHVEFWIVPFRGRGRSLSVNAGNEPVTALATTGSVGQALDVLLDNAMLHGSGDVHIEVTRRDRRSVVRLRDQGPGIPASLAGRIFEWNTSTGEGLGIGLSLARALIESDGGRLELISQRPAIFEIEFPRDGMSS